MSTVTSLVRAAALSAGATLLTAAALAPSASAWTAPYTTACSGSSIDAGGAAFGGEMQYRLGAGILDTTGYTLGTTQFASLSLPGTFEGRPNPIGTQGFGAPSTSALDCEGSGLTVDYARVGSGAGRNSWRANGTTTRDTTAAFVASDEGNNTTEQVNMQTSGMTSTGSTVETIPVAQGSVAIVANPPAGCSASGRAIKLTAVEDLFQGTISTWGQLAPGKLTPASCNSIPVQKFVRSNSSGTTFALKTTFASVDAAWNGFTSPSQNTVWPAPVSLGGTSNSAVAASVAANPGSIGYADLGAARNTTSADFEWSGTGDTHFWFTINVPLRGGTPGQTVSVDPAFDSTVGTTNLGSNCGTTRAYNNVPASTKGSLTNPSAGNWFTVEGSNPAGYKSYEYPICTLTYVFAYNKYARFPGMTQDKARTAYDYIRYVVSTSGQNLLAAGDYQKLPSALKTMANDGALRINW